MATEEVIVQGGLTLVFSAGVAWGMVRIMVANLQKSADKLESRMDRYEGEDCDDIVRRRLFDDSAMPRYMPVTQCAKQHADFASQLAKMESQIEARQNNITEALARIYTEVKK